MDLRRPKGFTFIELIVTVAIIGVLASIAAPLAELNAKRDKERELRRALREIRMGIDAYKQASDEGRIVRKSGDTGFPRRLEDLVDGVEDARAPRRANIYFLRRLPRDPFHPDATLPPAATWGKRSYASSPTSPQEGDDVFDVHSLSAGIGLNKVPYQKW